jgi:hypothetical protein
LQNPCNHYQTIILQAFLHYDSSNAKQWAVNLHKRSKYPIFTALNFTNLIAMQTKDCKTAPPQHARARLQPFECFSQSFFSLGALVAVFFLDTLQQKKTFFLINFSTFTTHHTKKIPQLGP